MLATCLTGRRDGPSLPLSLMMPVGYRGRSSCQRPKINFAIQLGLTTITNYAVHMLFPLPAWPEERARAVETTGGPAPLLPTPFPISEPSTAALAAIGLAVADLW